MKTLIMIMSLLSVLTTQAHAEEVDMDRYEVVEPKIVKSWSSAWQQMVVDAKYPRYIKNGLLTNYETGSVRKNCYNGWFLDLRTFNCVEYRNPLNLFDKAYLEVDYGQYVEVYQPK